MRVSAVVVQPTIAPWARIMASVAALAEARAEAARLDEVPLRVDDHQGGGLRLQSEGERAGVEQAHRSDRPVDDDGDRPAARRPLVLGTPRDEQDAVADQTAEHAADQGSGMAGGADVALVEHGVTGTAEAAVGAGPGLGQERHDAPTAGRRELALGG
jgi:hypothetical protein